MYKTMKTAFKIKDLRKKLLLTIGILLLIRLGTQFPVPGINLTYYKEWFQRNNQGFLNLFSAFSGGSFEKFSLFALGITPYITASIILQLLAVVFPSLEEMRRDGEYGKKKLEWLNRAAAVLLAFLESLAMAVSFGKTGILPDLNVFRIGIIVLFLTAGTAILIAAGELITHSGIGNGISMVLMANILSGLPGNFSALYETYIKHQTVTKATLRTGMILGLIIGMSILIVLLNEGCRKITVQYSKKLNGRSIGAQGSFIPIKVNLAGVAPVIFASSILSFPQMMVSILNKENRNGILGFLLHLLNQKNWFDKLHPEYTLGFFLYMGLILFFAFFYVSITYNSMEMAENLRKQGGCIPGIRTGKPTEAYIGKTVRAMTVIGTLGLMFVVFVPVFVCGITGANISFGGTSLIIIAGVILETMDQIEAMIKTHHYEGFLSISIKKPAYKIPQLLRSH